MRHRGFSLAKTVTHKRIKMATSRKLKDNVFRRCCFLCVAFLPVFRRFVAFSVAVLPVFRRFVAFCVAVLPVFRHCLYHVMYAMQS